MSYPLVFIGRIPLRQFIYGLYLSRSGLLSIFYFKLVIFIYPRWFSICPIFEGFPSCQTSHHFRFSQFVFFHDVFILLFSFMAYRLLILLILYLLFIKARVLRILFLS